MAYKMHFPENIKLPRRQTLEYTDCISCWGGRYPHQKRDFLDMTFDGEIPFLEI